MMRDKLSILDYGAGNLWSIKNALNFLGCEVNIINSPVKKAFKIFHNSSDFGKSWP